MCAGGDGVADSCGGDSCGPFVSTKENVLVLVGVVSQEFRCNKKNYSGVYVDVSKFIDWISSTTENDQGLQIVSAPNNTPTTAMGTTMWQHPLLQLPWENLAETTIYTNSCNDISRIIIYYVPNEMKLQTTWCSLVNFNAKEI